MDEKRIYINRRTWFKDLQLNGPGEDLESLSPLDEEALFDGMRKFFLSLDGIETVESKRNSAEVGATLELKIPGTNMFWNFKGTFKDWLKKLVKTVVLFTIVGSINPLCAFAGLTVDLAFEIFDKLSRLNEKEVKIVNAILELSKSESGYFPKTVDIANAMESDMAKIEEFLSSLKDRGIILYNTEKEGGWEVVF